MRESARVATGGLPVTGEGARRAGLGALAVLLAIGTPCATTGVRDPSRAFPTRGFTLPSGLRVVIEEDPNASMVGVVWVVDAGLVDDPQHQGELPHVVEHLVMDLPDADGSSAWARLLDLGGIDVNATTRLEQTTFQTFGPRGQLDRLVALELGRMASPLGRASDSALAVELAKQRSIVQEEESLREETVSHGAALLVARLVPATADHAGAGDRAVPVSIAQVRSFVGEHYQPQRMTLVLSGAIPASWDARLLGDAAAVARR